MTLFVPGVRTMWEMLPARQLTRWEQTSSNYGRALTPLLYNQLYHLVRRDAFTGMADRENAVNVTWDERDRIPNLSFGNDNPSLQKIFMEPVASVEEAEMTRVICHTNENPVYIEICTSPYRGSARRPFNLEGVVTEVDKKVERCHTQKGNVRCGREGHVFRWTPMRAWSTICGVQWNIDCISWSSFGFLSSSVWYPRC